MKFSTNSNFSFTGRVYFAFFAIAFLFLLLLVRLAWLQLFQEDIYTRKAESNRTVTITKTPSRGIIYDRNGLILAKNDFRYSLEITLSKVGNLEETLQKLSQVISITKADRQRFNRFRDDIGRYSPIPIRTSLTELEVAKFAPYKYLFPGVEISQRQYRQYPYEKTASHLLGYVGTLSLLDKLRLQKEDKWDKYKAEREIGKVGLERSYEDALYGEPGDEIFEITASGKPIRSLSKKEEQAGKNLHLSIDIYLQRVFENAFGNKIGSVIAIEPNTGRVLAFVSQPTYNPNLFSGGIDPKSWEMLNSSPRKPLLNRAMRGLYPIGSTYKPFVALAGLENKIITPQHGMLDPGYFQVGNHRFRDMSLTPKGWVTLSDSIARSSDVYYYWLATELGVEKLYNYMKPWGFGQKTGIDLIGEQIGVLPNKAWKEKRFSSPWMVGDTTVLGIGQGYNSFTLLQLAHATATLANKGKVIAPHLVDAIEDPLLGSKEILSRSAREEIHITKSHYDVVLRGMIDVTRYGTAKRIFLNTPYRVAAKTGTAQVVSIAQDKRYDKKKLAKKWHDHALFIAFAPAKNPKIAVAVLVENGGFGARAAAPIAKAGLDYWLTGKNTLDFPAPQKIKN